MPKNLSDETRARLAELFRVRNADPEFARRRAEGIRAASWAARDAARLGFAGVPAWVLPRHRAGYCEIARNRDEHAAAHWAREAKASLGS